MRIAAGVEYEGTAFCGWQAQKDGDAVQTQVEAALSAVADEAISVVCAGRTDAGVHALGQVIHFDTVAERSSRNWVRGANSQLPAAVRLHWAQPAADDFHARFSAMARTYRYLVLNSPTASALLRDRVCWQYRPLDAAAMHLAAQQMLGEHDFSAFRAAACQAHSPVREMQQISVTRDGDRIIIELTANAFLHHMVRNIAGALFEVGCGAVAPEWIGDLLGGRDRTAGAATAPPGGLYLISITYPDRFQIPAGAAPTGAGPR
jgi:tRNA pseudouridine38-40 synthase